MRLGRAARATRRWTGIALISAFVLSTPAPAAVILVDGSCSLRDAIESANGDVAVGGCSAGTGLDEIVLSVDVLLTEVDHVDFGPNGLPTVTEALMIDGRGFAIERSPGAPDFRLLHTRADLRLENLRLLGGRLADGAGGALRVHEGEVEIYDSLISGHDATRGAIYGSDRGQSSDIRLYRTDVVDNLTSGIASQRPVELRDSVVARNGDHGIDTEARTRVERSRIEDNEGDGVVGSFSGALTVIDSTVQSNDGNGFDINGDLTLRNSTVSGNGLAGVDFYAIYYSELEIDRSTVSGNLSDGVVTAGSSNGVIIKNATITGNGVFGLDASGFYPPRINLSNSIVSASGSADCSGDVRLTNLGTNLTSDGSCPGTGLLTGLDPVLGDNGGLTETHALEAGSSAIDAGDCSMRIDQRGYSRDGCDVGAFEFEGSPPLVIEVLGTCTEDTKVEMSAASPDAKIRLLFSPEVGTIEAPDGIRCGGILNFSDRDYDLRAPLFGILSAGTDSFGEASVSLVLPDELCGGWLQGVDLETCQRTPPIPLPTF